MFTEVLYLKEVIVKIQTLSFIQTSLMGKDYIDIFGNETKITYTVSYIIVNNHYFV